VKYFLIKYTFATGSPEAWHQEIARFIAALEHDPELSGKISYRCLKSAKGPDYYHFAAAADEQAAATLGGRDFFTHYTEACDLASGGSVEVMPLDLITETAFRP
jgi:hypothetical protein